jgi:small-conductance mechanosensitive channel
MEGDLHNVIQFIDFDRLPFAIFMFLVGWVVVMLSGSFLDDLAERVPSRRLMFKKAKAIVRFVLYFLIAVLVGSAVLRLESQALLALTGTIGVAVGFALKDLLGSLIAGVILLIDEPFQVGDRITFQGAYGEVTEIGLRSVRVVTLDDNAVTIPNNLFLTEAVASANAGALDCMVVVPFYIGAAEDFGRARRIVHEATVTSRFVYLNKPVVTLLEDAFLGERFVTIVKVKAYVYDARHEKSFSTDITERVKRAFAAGGIQTPDQMYRDLDLNEGRELAAGGV